MYWAWALLAILVAWIADEKGRSFWGWFFVGLITGPIGFIVALFLPRAPEEAGEKRE